MSDNLKKCPFCGSQNIIVSNWGMWRCWCADCKAKSEDGIYKKDAIEAWNRRTDNRWISVEDRLPDDDDSYLVWNGNHIFVAIYWGDGEWMFDSHATHEVAHWMPLPEPPKEDSDG